MTSYTIAFHHATPHGVVSAVHIPDAPDPVPDAVLEQLPSEEAEHARTLRGYRQVQFVGGRLALRAAAEQLGVRLAPVLTDGRGAPILPDGLAASISHKRTLAVAMAASAREGTLGVDLEEYGPPRPSIEPRVLTPAEIEEIAGLPEPRRWIETVLRFSVKESIYKALDPYVQRYVGFHEARVHPDLQGRARVDLDLTGGEGPFSVEARYEWLYGRILTSARIRPSTET